MGVKTYCVGIALMAASLMGGQDNGEQRWTERLKATPVSDIEPGLPATRFDKWFSSLVAPAQARYEVNDCGERNGTPEETGKTLPMCVSVTAELAPRTVQLSFVVGTYVVPKPPGLTSEEKPVKIALFHGSIGPSDPRMKFPTQVIRKLSEVAKLLH